MGGGIDHRQNYLSQKHHLRGGRVGVMIQILSAVGAAETYNMDILEEECKKQFNVLDSMSGYQSKLHHSTS